VAGAKKNPPDCQKGFLYGEYGQALDLTYLPATNAGWNWHLIAFFAQQVAKASQGHYPLPFWIRNVKNCCKYRNRDIEGKIFLLWPALRLFAFLLLLFN
jgi:hypothetical protein